MGKTVLSLVLSALASAAFAIPTNAIEFVSVELGILVVPAQYPCPVNPKTSKWAANDWDTVIVVQQKDGKEGDRVVAEVTVPSGRVLRSAFSWDSNFRTGCTWLFVPILGTDAETWPGTWRASISLNDKKVAEANWEVTPARDGAMAEYQAYLQANPKSARAHYRVGAAAALAGQDALAESELKEAAKLAPTWWYPYLALGRVYQRQGKKELAAEQFHFLKGLLMGRKAEPGSFTEYIRAMMEDHLQQLGQ